MAGLQVRCGDGEKGCGVGKWIMDNGELKMPEKSLRTRVGTVSISNLYLRRRRGG